MPFTGPLVGQQKLVGETYDLCLGYTDASGNTEMVGYVCAPGSQFKEATNLQDEEHLVQIASPLSTDRWGRFPKVSQGDWSGGERQLVYVNGNQYYSSQQCDVSKAGHLKCMGQYSVVTIPSHIRNIAFASGQVDGISSTLGFTYTVIGGAVANVTLLGTPYGVFDLLWVTSNGVYANDATTLITSDSLAPNPPSVAYFNGSIYYVMAGLKSIHSMALPGTGGAGTLVYTAVGNEFILDVIAGPNGLVFITQDLGSTGLLYVYTFDGTSATLVGTILYGTFLDMMMINGVVFIAILTYATVGQPIIYQLSGSSLSVFDDYNLVDPAFQANVTVVGPEPYLSSDGSFLYLFIGGLRAKAYNLATRAVYDIGNPIPGASTSGHIGVSIALGGSIAETDSTHATSLYVLRHDLAPNANGVITTSFYDFDTPNVDKGFKSVEFSMNSAIDAGAITVKYRMDNLSAALAPLTVKVSPSGNTLLAYFPARTIGHKVQLEITLVAAKAPDIASWSITATLARTWTVTVACRRGQTTRNPNDQNDPQAKTAQQLMANIENAYNLAAGNVVLWIPDPTVAQTPGGNGAMMQVNAQLQDFQRLVNASAGVGAHRTADGSLDFDQDVQLVLSEQL